MSLYVKSSDSWAVFRAGSWEFGVVRGSSLSIDGQQVVGSRAAGIPTPSGGTTIDSEARSAIAAILAALGQHGLIEL